MKKDKSLLLENGLDKALTASIGDAIGAKAPQDHAYPEVLPSTWHTPKHPFSLLQTAPSSTHIKKEKKLQRPKEKKDRDLYPFVKVRLVDPFELSSIVICIAGQRKPQAFSHSLSLRADPEIGAGESVIPNPQYLALFATHAVFYSGLYAH